MEIKIYCKTCHKLAIKTINTIPKNFVCPHCNCAQQVLKDETVPFTHGRNYPEGYFGN